MDAGQEAARLAASLATIALADTERSERAIQAQVARMMEDPSGKAFTTALTDQAFRSRSPSRTGDQIRHLLAHFGPPAYMTAFERGLFKLFELVSPWLPGVTSGAVMSRIRAEMSRVVLPGADGPLARRLRERNDEGVTVNLNHLGEAILGEEEARARLATYVHDLTRPNVRCVSVKISSIASQLNLLAWEDTLSTLSERMRTLYRTAMAHPHVRPDGSELPKLVYLDMEELYVSKLDRYTAWLDTGTFASLTQASQYVQVIEERQGLKVACLEEIAYRLGYIDAEQVLALAAPLIKSGYGAYLETMVSDGGPVFDEG